jgi:3-dehydroquinate dehydratase/shikimate dehydrogenase
MDRTAIVETVTADSMAELIDRRDQVIDADMVELRLDGVQGLDVAAALQDRKRPTIVTCRPVWEGGRWEGDEAGRRRIFAEAVSAGADYIDIERRAGWLPDTRGSQTHIVISDHEFTATPTDIVERLHQMRRAGGNVLKLAVTTSTLPDVCRLKAAVAAARLDVPVAVIGMGECGQVTRMVPSRFGSCWTYAGTAAPGQLPTRRLRDWYRVGDVSETTMVFGVAGSPLAHSASPAMHNAALRAAGIDAVYVPLPAASIGDIASAAAALDVAGLSLTAPLKTGWLSRPDVDADDEPARQLGVINTLKRAEGRWVARNFDVAGFMDGLDGLARRSLGEGGPALVIGAGGAAQMAAWALSQRGMSVSITARRMDAADEAARRLGVAIVAWPPTGAWDLLVQATPVGTWPQVEAMVLSPEAVEARVVYDMVYNPEETTFLSAFRRAGAVTIGGLEMLVGQAARQFEWWHGRPADRQVMRDAARAFVGEMTRS